MMIKPVWVVSQLIPPALLTYFGIAYWRCMTEVAPYISRNYGAVAGAIYRITSTALLPTVSILFLRLYFLPTNQSLPSRNPHQAIKDRRVIFECLSHEEAKIVELARQKAIPTGSEPVSDDPGADGPKVNRCWKGKCEGRWKPARARHCSECGVCRAGFDHHCAFFANCLTTPYMPCFLLTLVLTPIAVLGICLPLFGPFGHRFMEAFRLSRSDAQFSWWWDWWPSWIIAGGPIGRYAGGVALAWKEMDRVDGGGLFRLSNGILVAVGLLLSMIAGGLALSTVTLIRRGHLTIDRERQRSHARTRHAIEKLRAASQPIPLKLEDALRRYADIHHFYVPLPDDPTRGHIVATLPDEMPYDFGTAGNWELVMGSGWGWLNPLRAIRRGMGDEIYNWPIAPRVEARLLAEAERLSRGFTSTVS